MILKTGSYGQIFEFYGFRHRNIYFHNFINDKYKGTCRTMKKNKQYYL